MPDAAAHAAALAFERALYGRAAAEVLEDPLGVAFRDLGLPRAHMLNELWITHEAATLEAVLAFAERVQGELLHRKVEFEDEALGAAMLPGLRDAGWTVERNVVMTLRRPRDRDPEPGLAAEVDEATLAAVEAATDLESPYGGDPEVVQQVARARGRLRSAGSARTFVGTIDGVQAAHATLFSDGRVAQVEDVMTLEAQRKRGLARAVCSAAVSAAQTAGHELIFLVADADDFPRVLYAKLGFDPVGTVRAFTRHGPEHPLHAPRAAG